MSFQYICQNGCTMEHEKSIPDLSFLRKFTEVDNDKIKYYIGLYLQTAPRLFEGLKTAMDSRSYDELYIKAHSLKPQTAYVGLTGLNESLAGIENAARNNLDWSIIQELLKTANDFNNRGTKELESILKEL
jgi:HPt (histidine-containing phosphotransfer) domain-containing protein